MQKVQKYFKPILRTKYSTLPSKLFVGLIPTDKDSNYYLIKRETKDKKNFFEIPMSLFHPRDVTPEILAHKLTYDPKYKIEISPLQDFNLDNELKEKVRVLIYAAKVDEIYNPKKDEKGVIGYDKKNSKNEVNFCCNIHQLKTLMLEQKIIDPISLSALSPLILYTDTKIDREKFEGRFFWLCLIIFLGSVAYGFLLRLITQINSF